MNSTEFRYEPIKLHHYAFLEKILTNPQISKNFSKEKNYEKMEVIQILNQMIQFWNDYNFGIFVVYKNNDPIGIGGYKYITKFNAVEILYAIDEPFWNQGYASKIAKEILDYGLNVLKINVVYGVALTENIKSINILNKIGLKLDSISDIGGKKYSILKLENICNEYSIPFNCVVEIDL